MNSDKRQDVVSPRRRTMPDRVFNEKYREWRLKVLEAGGRKCSVCGSMKQLHCHHIRPWDLYPELRYDVSNGKVLCKLHHIDVHPFMVKYDKKPKLKKNRKLPKVVRRKVYMEKRLHAAIKRQSKFSCAERYSKKKFYCYGSKKIHILPK